MEKAVIHTTINEALTGKIETTGHELYIVRMEDTVLYIGHSIYPAERIRQHLTSHEPNGGSGKLAKLIQEHLPASLEWPVDFLSVDDCSSIVSQHTPNLYENFQQH